MILVFKSGLSEKLIDSARCQLNRLGLDNHPIKTFDRTLIVIESDARQVSTHLFQQLEGVEKLIPLGTRYPLTSLQGQMTITLGDPASTTIGGTRPILIAGPCSVESAEQILDLALAVGEAGATAIRGGAFKPRTSPYDFSGLGIEALHYLKEASRQSGLPVVTEILSAEQIEPMEPFVDMYQIGARNMYNYELLRQVGKTGKPILLKRAMSATIDEFLQAAEYILLEGNVKVVLCERGIRTFETKTRNTLDLNAVALLKSLTQLPVLVDPSHGTGRSDLVAPLSCAAIACGADGLLIEVHQNPSQSYSDAEQAITPQNLASLWCQCLSVKNALNAISAPPLAETARVPALTL